MKFILLFSLACLFVVGQNTYGSVYGYRSRQTPLVKITPIVGYEQSRSKYPDDRYQWRLVYGANVAVGMTILSLEVTGLRAQHSRTVNSEKIVDVSEKVQVGLVSKFYPTPMVGVMIRAGGQAEKRVVKATPSGGEETTKYDKVHYSPYAGAGISIPMATSVALEITANAVFYDFPNKLEDTDLQYTMGLKVAF